MQLPAFALPDQVPNARTVKVNLQKMRMAAA
jgi:hypothetical protein